jgi:hypothetical protein
MQRKMDWIRSRMSGAPWSPPSSGNRAFDEFRDFLERLRVAKDKTEFDHFMAARSNRPEPEALPPQQN